MKKFNWSEFKDTNNKIAVHCKTEEEANDFCREMHEHGMKWCDGDSYLEETMFNGYEDQACYANRGKLSDVDFYKKYNYEILEWSDYMTKEFTKADLKYGYLVVMRSENRAIYMPSTKGDTFDFQNNAECLLLDKYNDTLNYTGSEKYDVMKVYGLAQPYETTSFNSKKRSLVWEREKTKRMTVEEMKAKLEELLGEKIEVKQKTDYDEMLSKLNVYCSKQDDCFFCRFNDCCPISDVNIENKEFVKQCYEKVMEDGR